MARTLVVAPLLALASCISMPWIPHHARAPDRLWLQFNTDENAPMGIDVRAKGIEIDGEVTDVRTREDTRDVDKLFQACGWGASRDVIVFAARWRTEVFIGGGRYFDEDDCVCYVPAGQTRGEWVEYERVPDERAPGLIRAAMEKQDRILKGEAPVPPPERPSRTG